MPHIGTGRDWDDLLEFFFVSPEYVPTLKRVIVAQWILASRKGPDAAGTRYGCRHSESASNCALPLLVKKVLPSPMGHRPIPFPSCTGWGSAQVVVTNHS